ncbi:MAG: DNA glycosylase [Bacillota bacterium]|nr:DNA glycosylase [Bacillota bacterium]
MITSFYKNRVEINGISDEFEPKHIFECGQCFRWDKEEDGSYTGVVQDKILNVTKNENVIIFNNTNKKDFEEIWVDYFDLKRDYSEIKNRIQDDRLKDIIEFGNGIRILNQDEWETLISFIISANNRILMIKRVIDNLSRNYGEYIGLYRGKKYYSFPTVEKIKSLDENDLRLMKTGFRAKYIKDAADKAAKNKKWLYRLNDLSYDSALEEIKTIKGVGDKVGNCILLFSMNKYEAFPVDVWMKRIMEQIYNIKGKPDEVRKKSEKIFGEYSGFVQQYLFYYASQGKLKVK